MSACFIPVIPRSHSCWPRPKHFQRKCSHCIHFGEMGKWGNGEWDVGCGSGAAVPACSNACKQDLTIKF